MMDIRKLQRQAAYCVDELLSISGDMDAYVIAAYGQAPQEVVAMQCRFLLERLRRLEKKLTEIKKELACATKPGGISGESHSNPSAAEGLSGEQRRSISVTQQLIAQNLLLIARKEELLNGFLAHSDMIGIQKKRAKELQDTAEMIRLKEVLLRNS